MSQTPHQMHGVGQDTCAADWPALRADEVAAVLARFAPGVAVLGLHWHSPRPFSAAAEVHTSAGRWFVKRHHRRLRDARTLAEEHGFIHSLREHGAPVPQLLRTPEGASLLEDGDWTYEVQLAAEGEDLYREATSWTPFQGTAHARAAGAALARLHRAAASHAAPARTTSLLVANFRLFGQDDPVQALHRQWPQRPALAQWLSTRDWAGDLRRHLLPWHRQGRPWLATLPPPAWTHGDWHASNLLWRGHGEDTEVSAVFDFGLADRSFALFDLATAIERNLVPWLDLDQGGAAVAELDQLDALLHGYASVLPLTAAHLRTLAALMPLVHADFALSEVEYFAGITGSDEHAGVAYHRYLLGHADWFAGAEGQRLLQHLQRKARAAA